MLPGDPEVCRPLRALGEPGQAAMDLAQQDPFHPRPGPPGDGREARGCLQEAIVVGGGDGEVQAGRGVENFTLEGLQGADCLPELAGVLPAGGAPPVAALDTPLPTIT